MLVIISDLHLTDGTSGETIRPHGFKIFRERLRDAAYEASWRKGGTYRPIEELHLILLGDILDVIRSTKWLEGPGVRPWDDSQSAAFVAMVKNINEAILKQNAESLDVLRSLNDGKTTTLPPATAEGRPAKVGYEPGAVGRVPVEVKIHYLVGNHDWFYHLPGAAYNSIRQSVVDALGLANSPDAPFRTTRPSRAPSANCTPNTRCSRGTGISSIRSTSRRTATPPRWGMPLWWSC